MLPALGGLTPSQVGRQQESPGCQALALTDPPPIVLRSKQEMALPCGRYRLRSRLFSAWSIRHQRFLDLGPWQKPRVEVAVGAPALINNPNT